MKTTTFPNPSTTVYLTTIHGEPYVVDADKLNDVDDYIMIYRRPDAEKSPRLGFEIPADEAWQTLFHTARKGVIRVNVPADNGCAKRKHSVLDFVIVDEWNNPLLVYIDLTILRKSKVHDSVPLYRETDGEFSVAAIRSADWLHQHSIY